MIPAYPILQPFLQYLQFEKRYAQHTVKAYETDLLQFFDYLHLTYGELPLDGISHLYIRSWLATLKDGGLASKSINRKLSSLKSFFKHALRMGTLKQSPMARVVAPKSEQRLPVFVAEKDMHTLLHHMEFPDDWTGRTDRLLLRLLYFTGLRLSEVIGLRTSHIHFSSATLKVLGKGGKERVIPVPPELLADMRQYVEEKRTTFPDSVHPELLLNARGRPLAPRSVYTSVRRYLSAVTTVEKRSPHVLRHTFATHLTNSGADLNAVKELLGHSSLAATQVYTHNTIEKLKQIHSKAHPKA